MSQSNQHQRYQFIVASKLLKKSPIARAAYKNILKCEESSSLGYEAVSHGHLKALSVST